MHSAAVTANAQTAGVASPVGAAGGPDLGLATLWLTVRAGAG